MLTQRRRYIIGAFGNQRQDRLFHRQAAAGWDAKLGRRARRGVIAHDHAAIELRLAIAQRFKRHINRHHFGQRCREAWFIRAGVNQDGPCAGFHDNGGIARAADLRLSPAPGQSHERRCEHQPGESNGKAPQALATSLHPAKPPDGPRLRRPRPVFP